MVAGEPLFLPPLSEQPSHGCFGLIAVCRVCHPVCTRIFDSIYPSISIYLSVCLSIYLSQFRTCRPLGKSRAASRGSALCGRERRSGGGLSCSAVGSSVTIIASAVLLVDIDMIAVIVIVLLIILVSIVDIILIKVILQMRLSMLFLTSNNRNCSKRYLRDLMVNQVWDSSSQAIELLPNVDSDSAEALQPKRAS